MKLQIIHQTRYDYDREVQLNPHLLYLRPRENPLQFVEDFAFEFHPTARLDWMRDDFDNLPASAQFLSPSNFLSIQSRCVVTTTDIGPFDFMVRDYAAFFPFQYEPLHHFNLGIYLRPPDEQTQEALMRWMGNQFVDRPRETIAWLFSLNKSIQQGIRYTRRDELGIQTALTTISLGTGTCRDFAVVLIECARTLGLAARFVSGYLYDPSIDVSSPGDMHAWVEVFLPGAGWRGLDPTHGIFCDNAYVPVAHAVVAESVNPVQGSFYSVQPAYSRLSNNVNIQRLD